MYWWVLKRYCGNVKCFDFSIQYFLFGAPLKFFLFSFLLYIICWISLFYVPEHLHIVKDKKGEVSCPHYIVLQLYEINSQNFYKQCYINTYAANYTNQTHNKYPIVIGSWNTERLWFTTFKVNTDHAFAFY